MPTLQSLEHPLAAPLVQLQTIEERGADLPTFREKLVEADLWPLRARQVSTLQINLGKMCNQTCTHCHVDAGPDRTEIMSRETMEWCLQALERGRITNVDLTGGAPELNPHFEWFLDELAARRLQITVRSNLTILTVPKYRHLPEKFAAYRVKVVSSLPCYTAENTDRQRGEGVFAKSIEALRSLNAVGYGRPGTGLELHLVYNPGGPFLPPPQAKLKADYQRHLREAYGIVFNELLCITNMPISRFLQFLVDSGQYEKYMAKLVAGFNPCAAANVMCRDLVSVGWDGRLYDCDFNQMLELPVETSECRHIRDFDPELLGRRVVCTARHCFGCTAGSGSSCGGELVR
ncbi:MAG: arsenosugar biosynthesis radical SAM protein ArsS [Acidobacteriota bacterium]